MLIGVVLVVGVVTLAVLWQFRNLTSGDAEVQEPAPEPIVAPDAKAGPGALTPDEVFHRFDELALGCAIEAREPEHFEIIEAIRDVFARPPEGASYAPRRPMLLPQLMRALNDEQASRQQIVSIISQDPSLVGRVLKLANSAYYRVSRQQIASLDRGVAVMGAEGVRSVATSALFEPMFRIDAGPFGQAPALIWQRSFLAASAAEAYAATLPNGDPQAAQLLGFLDGLGCLGILRVSVEHYAAQSAIVPDASAISQLMRTLAPRAAQRHAQAWELSPLISSAIAEHGSGAPLGQRSGLAQSLGFGRLMGTLLVLRERGLVDEARIWPTLAIAGAPREKAQHVLKRLSVAGAST